MKLKKVIQTQDIQNLQFRGISFMYDKNLILTVIQQHQFGNLFQKVIMQKLKGKIIQCNIFSVFLDMNKKIYIFVFVLNVYYSQYQPNDILRKYNNQKKMGQKCCAQLPQREYMRSQSLSMHNPIPTITDIPQTPDIPQGLQTVAIPTLNKQVHDIYQQLTPYNSKSSNRIRGTLGDPKLLNQQGTVYVGEWKQCMPHGKGIMYFSDGSVYEGIFNQGTPDKEGRLINNNGVYYQGEISNGQAFGEGKFVNHYKKYTYQGNWNKDIPMGIGKQKWGNQISYQGNFNDGKKEGSGKYSNKGNFQYNGVFQNAEINHNGRVAFEGGDSYQGMFRNGVMNGFGTYTWKDGSIYQGQFLNGKKDGKGKYKDANGSIFDGMWRNGKRHGKGILKIPGLDEMLNWEWKNDVPVQKR